MSASLKEKLASFQTRGVSDLLTMLRCHYGVPSEQLKEIQGALMSEENLPVTVDGIPRENALIKAVATLSLQAASMAFAVVEMALTGFGAMPRHATWYTFECTIRDVCFAHLVGAVSGAKIRKNRWGH